MVGEEDGGSPEALNHEKAWKKAEKLIAKNKAEAALSLLREVDAGGAHQTTLRLAGMATQKIAQHTKAKSDYRKAASLLRVSVKANSKDKKSRKAHDDLLNEMLEKGVRLRSFRNVGYVFAGLAVLVPVSYTHLTLPTIPLV